MSRTPSTRAGSTGGAPRQRVTEMMLTGAAAIEALATNRLDVDDFLGKAERYLGLVDVKATAGRAGAGPHGV